ncbi:MAG: hypothetical protein ACI4PF_05355, partial [Christensenellales bacterium]
ENVATDVNNETNKSVDSAVSSLKDRINRLQKFKDENYTVKEDQPSATSDTLGGMYDMLSKEKARKSSQVKEKNIRSRESIDSINDEPTLDEYLRRKNAMENEYDEMER